HRGGDAGGELRVRGGGVAFGAEGREGAGALGVDGGLHLGGGPRELVRRGGGRHRPCGPAAIRRRGQWSPSAPRLPGVSGRGAFVGRTSPPRCRWQRSRAAVPRWRAWRRAPRALVRPRRRAST